MLKRTVKKASAEVEHLPIVIVLLILLALPIWSEHNFAFADQERTQAIPSEPQPPPRKGAF